LKSWGVAQQSLGGDHPFSGCVIRKSVQRRAGSQCGGADGSVGVDLSGHRKVLGLSISLSKQEIQWRMFLETLIKRGLRGVRLIISDDYFGLKAALQALFGGVLWQCCQFHLQQMPNRIFRVKICKKRWPRISARFSMLQIERGPWNTSNRRLANTNYRLREWPIGWNAISLKGLTVFSFPTAHRILIGTTNGLERRICEIKRTEHAWSQVSLTKRPVGA